MPTTRVIGDQLEQRVAIYYEAMGYQVGHDVLVSGHQVDLVATRHLPGVGEIIVAIEVKSRASVLGVNDVTTWIAAAKHIYDAGGAGTLVLVTNGKVSPKARIAVETQRYMKLLTINDLELHLFNNAESLLRAVRDYEARPIHAAYYQLNAKSEEHEYRDVAEHIATWASGSAGLLILIGDFGSGKSTIMERVFYNAAKQRIENHNALFPVLLRLKGMRQFTDLWQFIEKSLRDVQYIAPPRVVFEHELNQGRLLLLLDGFDEIYSGATAADRADYLDFLRPLLKSRSPLVLSSRPTFFQSFEDLLASARRLTAKEDSIERLPDFGLDHRKIARAFGTDVNKALKRNDFARVFEIQQLDKSQIRQAIELRAGEIEILTHMSVDGFEAALYDIYDLEDLMSRPLLLDMILSTIGTGGIDIRSAKTVGAATLYDIYTQRAAIRDKNRSTPDQYLTPELRLEACRALARTMYTKGSIILSAGEVETTVAATLAAARSRRKGIDDVARAVTDVRTCSFLGYTDDDSLTFKHKSFYEFFIAQDIFLARDQSARAFLSYPRHRLNREIVYFLASYVRDQSSFASFIKARLRESHPEEDRSFLYSLAFAAGEVLEKSSLTGGTIEGVELAKASIRSAFAMSSRIAECSVRRVRCDQWKLTDVALDACQFSEVVIAHSDFAVTSSGSRFDRCQFVRSTLTVAEKDISFSDVEFSACTLDLNCATVFSGCKLSDCDRIHIGPKAKLFGDKTSFTSCTLIAASDEPWYAYNSRVELSDCRLSGLTFSGHDIFTDLETHADRRLVLQRCSGIIYLTLTPELEKKGAVEAVVKANPDLFVIKKTMLDQIQRFLRAHKGDSERVRDRSARRADSLGPKASAAAKAFGSALPEPSEPLRKFCGQLRGTVETQSLANNQIPDTLRRLLRLVPGE